MIEKNSIAAIRKVYQLQSLLEKNADANPLKQFEMWWQHAIESKIEEPNAMTLATCSASGKPSARIVLLKGITENGFIFFTNYTSRKGKEIEANPFVSLLFFWKEMERQVRIEGSIKKISARESDDYFSSRPRESRIGAWCSPQSAVIDSREFLQKNVEKYNAQFGNEIIPRPDFWGGYLVTPDRIEFWQGRPGRLHDRLQYSVTENRLWNIERLAP
ncbi:MAG: pyridoxamine 5'-phosphate oxidase [Ginsengibacter sp.]